MIMRQVERYETVEQYLNHLAEHRAKSVEELREMYHQDE